MNTHIKVEAVYYEIVRKPYFVIVCARIGEGHRRYDKFSSEPTGLIDFMLQVVAYLTHGKPEVLDRMCILDEQDLERSAQRSRRYISNDPGSLYEPIQYSGYGFSTNANKQQAFGVVSLACNAMEVPYKSIRKFGGIS